MSSPVRLLSWMGKGQEVWIDHDLTNEEVLFCPDARGLPEPDVHRLEVTAGTWS